MTKLDKFVTFLIFVRSLSQEFFDRLVLALSDDDIFKSDNIIDYAEQERFADGRSCPHCDGTHIVRNGKRRDGVQRYLCRECGKSFLANTNTVTSHTRKNTKVWEKYIECMMNGMSLRDTARICKIHRNTAFLWRHKILDSLQVMQDAVLFNGIVEADETFFPVSNIPMVCYKGNHKNSRKFTMPREPHKRGHSIRKQGFSKNHQIELIQLENGKAKKGIYNIQHINNYHSLLKVFLYKFKGVSTKYLNNYLVWHNFVNYAKGEYKEKMNILFEHIITTTKNTGCRDISNRPPLPLLC